MNAGSDPVPGVRQREIFLGALERSDPEERLAYLRSACGGDEVLRRSVEELLGEEGELKNFLQLPALEAQPAQEAVSGTSGQVANVGEQPGDCVGPYKLLEKLGEGGWGVVYRAEQQEPIRREIALKIIKLGMDTRQVIARFEAERQALALMEHPNIARVFEAGSTESGRPYFAMELVRGLRITEYCDQNRISTRTRLTLFIQICNAIQHAHQKGVIHRDIKPSNILVTTQDGAPVPKIIDFGIAKAAARQRLTERTLVTGFDQFLGTPAYMSPEQTHMGGLDVDTRTDIYSLGVLLYELLTGKTPFDRDLLMHLGLDECRRTIREIEPPWPSARLSSLPAAELKLMAQFRRAEPSRLIHVLRGDPDSIVMKALEKDRARRYATANDLALDIERYLNNEPVAARPPSNWYRVEKLVRRHKPAFAAAAIVSAVIVGGAGVSGYLALRALEAERQASDAQRFEARLRREAEVEGRRARDQAALARRNEYVADINLAHQSLADGNFGRAVRLLKKYQARPREKDPRGFEWRYLWRLAKGDEHLSLSSQDGAIRSLAFSDDGKLLAVISSEKLKIVDPANDAVLAVIPGSVLSAAFLPQKRGLVTSGPQGVQLWSALDWTEQKSMERSFGPVALSRDGTRLGTITREGLRVWDTCNWTDPHRFADASGPVAFSSDAKRVAASTLQGVTVWRLADSAAEAVLRNTTNLFRGIGPGLGMGRVLSFSPDDRWIIAIANFRADRDSFVVRVWDAQNGQESKTLPEPSDPAAHTGMISSFDFSPDGRILATASMDHSVCLWDFPARRLLASLHGHLNEVYSVAFSPGGKSLITGAKDGGLKWWAAQRQPQQDQIPAASRPLGFSRDGLILAALNAQQDAVLFFNIASGQPEQRFQLEPRSLRPASSIALSADLKLLAEGLNDGRVRLWNTAARAISTFKASERPIDLVMLSPDGCQMITGAFQEPFRWWDLKTGANINPSLEAQRCCFSADGLRLAALHRDRIEFWDVPSRSKSAHPSWPAPVSNGALFSPDGRILVTIDAPANSENAIRLWDATTGKALGACAGHKQAVRSVAYSPDGKTLASSSDDSTLKLWNAATQQELLTIHLEDGPVSYLQFSPDGTLLAAASGSSSKPRSIHVFRAPFPEENDGAIEEPAAKR